MIGRTKFWIVAALTAGYLSLGELAQNGFLKEDEPRYASIGRQMARSGDWISPVLWGEPWFEKPPLIYWTTAAATRVGLHDEWAARLPVALVSLAFLVFYYLRLRVFFGADTAWAAAVMLASSIGWVAYSHLAVPDLLLSATLGAALLSMMSGWFVAAGILLGLAILAKALVPVALAAPVVVALLIADRSRWKGVLTMAAIALAIALPWNIAMYQRFGRAFVDELYIRHHWQRFRTGEDLHGRPIWFYVPVLAAGLFPWIPMFALLFRPVQWRDPARRMLFVWLTGGFAVLSVPAGKLPGYILPLFPAAFALIGREFAGLASKTRLAFLALCAWLAAGLAPAIEDPLVQALQTGLSRASSAPNWKWMGIGAVGVVGVAATALLARQKLDRPGWVALIAGTVFASFWWSKRLDVEVSSRFLWRTEWETHREQICIGDIHRAWRYGLNYYSETPLPDCDKEMRVWRLETDPAMGRPRQQVAEESR
ncbi:MAG: glycosyltransferase family 39 protein [Bryobacteraceae bacterium]